MNLTIKNYPTIYEIQKVLEEKFPYFGKSIERQFDEFGDRWLKEFEIEMCMFFRGDLDRLRKSVYGYGCFALDGMKLQKEFDRTRVYRNKTYEQASMEVYQNREYMFELYLPGILISHFLWRHHYVQQNYFRSNFVPLVLAHSGATFYDVGVGTGFYSKEMLRWAKDCRGFGLDLSDHSIKHTVDLISGWGLGDRYTALNVDITCSTDLESVPFILSIEVLEHLEDPVEFLGALYGLLEEGGYGFISAALTAPNADHIFLYQSAEEVIGQVNSVGFKIVSYIEDRAYEPRKQRDSVPRNFACIVERS